VDFFARATRSAAAPRVAADRGVAVGSCGTQRRQKIRAAGGAEDPGRDASLAWCDLDSANPRPPVAAVAAGAPRRLATRDLRRRRTSSA